MGKTNFALRVLEQAFNAGLIDKIATNIKTDDERVTQICYMDDLERWLKTDGRKGILLDELGKHLSRVRFMTELSKLLFDAIQLAGHYNAHFIGCTVTAKLIDKLFIDNDILDCRIHKLSWKIAEVRNYVTRRAYTITHIPPTRIPYNSKDVARFDLVNPKLGAHDFDKLPRTEQCAQLYLLLRSYRKVARIMKCSFQNVGDLLDSYCKKHNLTRLKVSS